MQFDQLRRRDFITLLGGTAAWPLAARAQQGTSPIRRIGIIDDGPMWDHFRQGLRELGYIEGQTVVIDYRSAEGKPDRLAAVASELARLPVDVIVTFGTAAAYAAKEATRGSATNPHEADWSCEPAFAHPVLVPPTAPIVPFWPIPDAAMITPADDGLLAPLIAAGISCASAFPRVRFCCSRSISRASSCRRSTTRGRSTTAAAACGRSGTSPSGWGTSASCGRSPATTWGATTAGTRARTAACSRGRSPTPRRCTASFVGARLFGGCRYDEHEGRRGCSDDRKLAEHDSLPTNNCGPRAPLEYYTPRRKERISSTLHHRPRASPANAKAASPRQLRAAS